MNNDNASISRFFIGDQPSQNERMLAHSDAGDSGIEQYQELVIGDINQHEEVKQEISTLQIEEQKRVDMYEENMSIKSFGDYGREDSDNDSQFLLNAIADLPQVQEQSFQIRDAEVLDQDIDRYSQASDISRLSSVHALPLNHIEDDQFKSIFQASLRAICALLTCWTPNNHQGCYLRIEDLSDYQMTQARNSNARRSTLPFIRVNACLPYIRFEIPNRNLNLHSFIELVDLPQCIQKFQDSPIHPESVMQFVSQYNHSVILYFPLVLFGLDQSEQLKRNSSSKVQKVKLLNVFRQKVDQIIQSSKISKFVQVHFAQQSRGNLEEKYCYDAMMYNFFTRKLNTEITSNVRRRLNHQGEGIVEKKDIDTFYKKCQKLLYTKGPTYAGLQLVKLSCLDYFIEDVHMQDEERVAIQHVMQAKIAQEVQLKRASNKQIFQSLLTSAKFVQLCIQVPPHIELSQLNGQTMNPDFDRQFNIQFEFYINERLGVSIKRELAQIHKQHALDEIEFISQSIRNQADVNKEEYYVHAQQYLQSQLRLNNIHYGSLQHHFTNQFTNIFSQDLLSYGDLANVCFDPCYRHANFSVLPIMLSFVAADKYLTLNDQRNNKSCILFGSTGMGKTYYTNLITRMFKGKSFVPNQVTGQAGYFDSDAAQFKLWVIQELNDPFKLAAAFYKNFFDFGAYCGVQVKFENTIDLPIGRVGFICSNHDLTADSIEHHLQTQKGKVNKQDIEAMISRFTIIYVSSDFQNYRIDENDANIYPEQYNEYQMFSQFVIPQKLMPAQTQIKQFSQLVFQYAMIFIIHKNPFQFIHDKAQWMKLLNLFEQTIFGQIIIRNTPIVAQFLHRFKKVTEVSLKTIRSVQPSFPAADQLIKVLMDWSLFKEIHTKFCIHYSKLQSKYDASTLVEVSMEEQAMEYNNFKQKIELEHRNDYRMPISPDYEKKKKKLRN